MKKKFITIVMIFVFALTLTGCGKEEQKSGTEGTTNNNNQQHEQPKNDTKANLTTVEGWLKNWGLSEADFKPANFSRLDKTSYNSSTYEINEVGAYINVKLTDEEARAWLDHILDKLRSMSKEGKLTNTLDNDNELTTDYIMNQSMHIGSGTFTYNGKTTTALITVRPNSLDSEDPDEAMPACTLQMSQY